MGRPLAVEIRRVGEGLELRAARRRVAGGSAGACELDRLEQLDPFEPTLVAGPMAMRLRWTVGRTIGVGVFARIAGLALRAGWGWRWQRAHGGCIDRTPGGSLAPFARLKATNLGSQFSLRGYKVFAMVMVEHLAT
jgi:hypothetical protein